MSVNIFTTAAVRAISAVLLAVVLCLSILAASAAASGSIVGRLSSDHAAIEITAVPSGTTAIHVALMSDMAGHGLKYLNLPASQTRYVPPAATPVVDVQAMKSGVALGGWSGRRQTVPARAETPIVEAPEVKAPKEGPSQARMVVGLDTGGWNWESAVRDFSGAVKYVRASSDYYNSDAQMTLLSKYGVRLMPLFNAGNSIGSTNKSEYANKVLAWFKRYGQGGTFWVGKEDLGANTAEILNEPGNPYFWSDSTNRTAYASLIETVHSTLASLSDPPRLLVSYDGGYEGDNYGRALVKADPGLLSLGLGWTVHPYGGHGSSSALGNRARVTEAYADTKQAVYVTEIGWPTASGKAATGDSLQWSEAQQAENLTGFFGWSYGLGYVHAVLAFNYADYEPNNYYGIVNTSGTGHKRSFTALAAAAAKW